ncbi:MAG: hypothetical protein JOZ57_18025 [Abitibacteriaceae bacterium]|nr:hypothetical protein [Abditibacteriaceae bacterium]
MNLPFPTQEAVEEFKQLYLQEFGKELSDEEAWEGATLFLQLFYLGTYGDRTVKKEL